MAQFSEGVAEIVLIVSDVIRSAEFYREVVGLTTETVPNEDWAWFWTGEEYQSARLGLHRGELLFEEHSPLPPGQRFGRVHYAFRVARPKFESAVRHVESFGIEVYGPTQFPWMQATSYYFYDPDGNLLEWWSPEETYTINDSIQNTV